MPFFHKFRRLSIPFFFLTILLNINPNSSELRASNKIIPANEKDLELYKSMGITYMCTISSKGTDADYEKSLIVATNLFSTVVEQKHGGFIKEGKNKEQKVDPRLLQKNIMFQLVGGTLNYCPDNVPESMEKDFKDQYEIIQKLNKNN